MGQELYTKASSKFDNTMEKFLGVISNTLRQSSVKVYFLSIKEFFYFLESRYPEISRLSDLKRSPHIEGWLSYLAEKGLTKTTRCMRIGDVQRFLEYMYEWDWKDVPQPGLITSKDIPKPDKCLPKPLSPDDDRKLQEILRNDHRFLSQAVFLLRKTGMRVGELRNLKIDSLEKLPSEEYTLHVPLGKIHTERIIPVDTEAADVFNRLLELRGKYLPLPDERTGVPVQFLLINKNNWSRPCYMALLATIYSAARRAGIKRVTLHQLRHTYATELARAGINLPALMKLLGHKNINMTLRYTGVSQQDLYKAYKEAMEKSRTLSLLPKQHNNNLNDKPDLLDTFDSFIRQLDSIRKDSSLYRDKKNLQRISERLRRAYQDIKDSLET